VIGNEPEYIDYHDVIALHQTGGAIIVDARHDFDYGLGHIAGSVSLPLKEFEERREQWNDWKRDTIVITYCDGQECNSSIELAQKLAAAGFLHVKFFFGGWNEWTANGGPTEGIEE
jgi:rhodanese-related sulfurtransferase